MKYPIIRDKNYLRKPTSPVSSIDEGMSIAKELIEVMSEIRGSIGLSANQIGIPKQVSIVMARMDGNPWILINPKITESSEERIGYLEGCLSLPGKRSVVSRSTQITVTTLNHANPIVFKADVSPTTVESVKTDLGLFECVCVQHEVDHLNGKLIIDSDRRLNVSVKSSIKYGRNDKVIIEKSGETRTIKFKHIDDFLLDGWRII